MVTVSLDVDGDADLSVPFSAAGEPRRAGFANANTVPLLDRCGVLVQWRSRADGMPFSYRASLVR
jgi:hypothetical protein